VRRAVGEQPVIVGVGPLAPTMVGVVHGLLRQHHEIVVGEVDHSIVVHATLCPRLFHRAHGSKRTQGQNRYRWSTRQRPPTLVASDGVTTPSNTSPDDSFWSRPGDPATPSTPPATTGSEPTRPAYPGPPSSAAPPAGWRPPVHLRPPPPRQLPSQDLPSLVAQERGARTLTYGVGLIAGAVLLVVMCLLCSRVLF
jgi:hypothetical protein